MATTLPGIFPFRVKMARIFGLKLVHSVVKRPRVAREEKLREVRTAHACADVQNKRFLCDDFVQRRRHLTDMELGTQK